ncbi:MAG: signal peptide peptidase SppA [Candidatus Nanohaloarchaea archaeon]
MKKKALLLSVLLLSASAAGFSIFQSEGKAAVISLSGTIQPSSQGFSSGGITPQQVRELTTRALEKNPDALIYEINSGGGAVVASKEVMRSIDSVEKPTVCRIRDIGASGAYLAALGCDRIVADSMSMTGSIGVKASYMEYSGLLRKLGVEHVNLTAGSRKDMGSRYRNITEMERELLEQKIDTIHRQFVSIVHKRRNLSSNETEAIRTGEAFLGRTAKGLGLVDSLGGRKTALEVAENMTGKELETVEVRRPEQFNFLSLLTASTGLDIFSAEAPFSSSYR